MWLYELTLLPKNKVTSHTKRHSMRNEIKLRVIFTATFAQRIILYRLFRRKSFTTKSSITLYENNEESGSVCLSIANFSISRNTQYVQVQHQTSFKAVLFIWLLYSFLVSLLSFTRSFFYRPYKPLYRHSDLFPWLSD